MNRDYQILGLTDKALTAGAGQNITADVATGTAIISGFLVLLAVSDCVLTSVVMRFPRAGITMTTGLTLKAGAQLIGVASFTHTSGDLETFFFKS